VIQADFVVRACVLLGRRADEAVVDEQLVVRVSAVCGQDFFANRYSGVSVRIPNRVVLLTCTVVPGSEAD
jgi:hypothetical protein